MAHFTDRTGLLGPWSWRNQSFSEGAERLPVTGITWYEAAAYAAWKAKRLPTVLEWQRASRADTTHPLGIIMPRGTLILGESVGKRAHFSSERPEAVENHRVMYRNGWPIQESKGIQRQVDPGQIRDIHLGLLAPNLALLLHRSTAFAVCAPLTAQPLLLHKAACLCRMIPQF